MTNSTEESAAVATETSLAFVGTTLMLVAAVNVL